MATNPPEPAPRDPLGDFEDALAGARPSAPDREGVRRLRLQSVLAAVLGPEVGLPRVGRFVIEQRVGAGGMGVVFRGRDAETGEPAAIKVLGRDASQERSRFEREAKLLKAIDHPHVVRYLDDGLSDDGQAYLVMEWLEGNDLSSRVQRQVLDVREALTIGVQLAEALHCAHQSGIVHRDVKPSNVFLVHDRVDAVKLIDFGVARSSRATLDGARLTSTGAILGSPHYMAPEQIRGHHDARTDVYGIGATLFDGLCGRPPFRGEDAAAVLLSVMAEPAPSLAMFRDDLPPGLDALVGRMLAKEMGDRPRDMAAVVAELSDLLARPLVHQRAPAALSRLERPLSEAAARGSEPRQRLGDGSEDGTEEPLGRVREIAQIRGIVAESEQEELASVVVVTGDAGMGKTHLLRHVLQVLPPTSVPGGWRVLSTTGRQEERGVPLAALRPLIAGAASGEDAAVGACRARMLGLVDALSSPGSGAPSDPRVVADQLQLTWLELIELWSRGGPLLMVVDDAGAADASTLRFLDRALSQLRQRAVVVIATARGQASELALGVDLPAERRLQLHLGPLRERGAQRLAARWLAPGVASDASALVAMAGGDPAYLRELCRDARGGRAGGLSSMAEITRDRLNRLEPEARRLLRAGSVFGRTFWAGAIGALLALDDDARLLARLDALVVTGHLRRPKTSRISGEIELELASELVMLAAYELNTPDDLRRGHAAAADWLEHKGVVGAAVIAAHRSAAGDLEGALPLYLHAARAALSGEEPTAFDEHIARAEACSPGEGAAADIAELRALRSFWAGRMDEAARTARGAWSTLPEASEGWFRVASLSITAAGQSGDNESVKALAAALHQASPGSETAREARLIGLCRAQTQLQNADLAEPWLLAAVEAEEGRAAGPEARAWLARSRCTRSARLSFDASIGALVEAHLAHVEAGDQRSAAQIGIFLASYYVWSGAWGRAASSLDDALTIASRLGASYLVSWGEYVRGKLEVEAGPLQKAMATLDGVVASASSSIRFRMGAHLHASVAALKAGHAGEAEQRARAVHQRSGVRWVERAAAAALCRSLLAQGRVEEARPLGRELAPLDPENLIVELDELVMLARVELASALGDEAGAAQALSAAVATIERRAATLSDPLRRNDYLARPHLVVRTLELARR
jgi:tetratricopeptide (TPR) repeat protein